MFQPVSSLPYRLVTRAAQALLIQGAPPSGMGPGSDVSPWEGRVAAILHDKDVVLRDVVRDILANPQIRAVVLSGPCAHGEEFTAFWSGLDVPPWKIDTEHVALVRQFVDLFDEDFMHRGPQQPFWPTRVRYLQ